MRANYLIALIILSGCGSKNNQNTTVSELSEDRIVLTAEQISMLGIQTDSLKMSSRQTAIRFSAVMENSPLGRAVVCPKLVGYIKAILISEGSVVTKGQPLAELENLELIKMQEEFLSVSAELDFLNKEIARQRTLNQNKSVSDKALQETEMRLIQANAKRSALIIELRLLGIDAEKITANAISGSFKLFAPIDGMVNSPRPACL